MKNFFVSTFLAVFASTTLVQTASAQPSSLGECLSVDIQQFQGNSVEAAIATPELSTLVDAVVAAGLDDALANTENITVYAPTNDAFAAIPADILEAITGDVHTLTDVLLYHVTPGRYMASDVVELSQADTVAGKPVNSSNPSST